MRQNPWVFRYENPGSRWLGGFAGLGIFVFVCLFVFSSRDSHLLYQLCLDSTHEHLASIWVAVIAGVSYCAWRSSLRSCSNTSEQLWLYVCPYAWDLGSNPSEQLWLQLCSMVPGNLGSNAGGLSFSGLELISSGMTLELKTQHCVPAFTPLYRSYTEKRRQMDCLKQHRNKVWGFLWLDDCFLWDPWKRDIIDLTKCLGIQKWKVLKVPVKIESNTRANGA